MKTVSKFLTLGAMMGAFVFANATSAFAQEDEKTTLYTKFTECYRGTTQPQQDTCYAGAKEFLDKFEKDNDQYTQFVRKQYDRYLAGKENAKTGALYERFNKSVQNPQAVNLDEAFASGREIMAKTPDLVDVPIVLASVGFDNAVSKTPNERYLGEAVNYAKLAIQKLEAGKTSENYGAYSYSYKTKEFPDGKSNALGWMNYTIGYIMYNRQNQKKEALPYLYRATQLNSGTKTYPELYRIIGSWYVDEFIRMDAERVAKIKAAGDQDTEETKAMLAMQKGYADRAVEAYARAYKVAGTDAANKAYRDSLLNRVRELYAIRFNKDMSGFDAYMAGVMNKPFTDPNTAVVPVVDTSTTGSAPSAAMTMTNSAATETTSAGRSTGTAAKAGTGTSTGTPAKAATKTPAKKPAPKKKGTR